MTEILRTAAILRLEEAIERERQRVRYPQWPYTAAMHRERLRRLEANLAKLRESIP